MHLLAQIAEEINKKSEFYEIGNLQNLRKEIGGLSRLPSKKLFDQRTVFEEWGWHYGGRKELQFNIGIEDENLRYGVAFSLDCSQSLPNIDILIPKILLFNEYLSEYSENFSDLRMWHYEKERSCDYMPSSIPQELIKEGVFIFFGGKQDKNKPDYSLILATFDRLLPLYLFTEKAKLSDSSNKVFMSGFQFKSGCNEKASATTGNLSEKMLNITLRHNDIQFQLYTKLANLYGNDNVGTEIKVNGVSIDLVVKHGDEYWFYEIKTASTVKACIRQALGQILEYSYWPGHQVAQKIIIVGESVPCAEEKQYLEFLRSSFGIPLEYQVENCH